MLYGSSTTNQGKAQYLDTLKQGLFEIKTAIAYMIASSESNTTSDLSACPILRIINDGDQSTGFLVGSDYAIINMANILLNDVIFGTTVIQFIYNIEYGS